MYRDSPLFQARCAFGPTDSTCVVRASIVEHSFYCATIHADSDSRIGVVGHAGEFVVCDLLDETERAIIWDTLFEVDEGKHGGLGVETASYGTFS